MENYSSHNGNGASTFCTQLAVICVFDSTGIKGICLEQLLLWNHISNRMLAIVVLLSEDMSCHACYTDLEGSLRVSLSPLCRTPPLPQHSLLGT